MAAKRHQSIFVLMLLVAAVTLLVSSYQQLAWINSASSLEDDTRRKAAAFNLFLGEQQAQQRDEVAELERVLEFMVWPSLELPLRRRLLNIYQRRVNQAPLNSELWLNILYQQSLLPDQRQMLGWTLGNALATSSWRHKAFATLSYNCIKHKSVLTEKIGQACNELLAHSYGQPLSRNIHRSLGLSQQQVEQILLQAKQAL